MDHYFTTAYNVDEIVQLRKIAFSKKYLDRVNLDGLDWNRTDQNSHHFSYRCQNRLTSTLRITFYKNLEKFNSATQIPLNSEIQSPYVLLARAATLPEYSKSQLHAKLRIKALEFCLQNNIERVFGSLQKKSNRLSTLLSQGYEVLETKTNWDNSYLKNDGDVVLIGLLSKEKIKKFIELQILKIDNFEANTLDKIDPIFY